MDLSLLAIGERLKELRTSRGWTQAELATRLCLNQSMISGVEGGHRKPSRNMLEALRRGLGVSTDWLLYGEGEGPGVGEKKSMGRMGSMGAMGGMGGMGVREGVGGYGLVVGGGKSRWGYAERESAEDVRVRAALDSGLRGTNLERLVMDDSNWELIQPLRGEEMEYLREFCEAAGDPPVISYVAVLEFLRAVGLGGRGKSEG